MPWDYILGGAGGAGLVLVLGILFAQKLIERTVDGQFEAKLEDLRGEWNTKLEQLRGELTRKLEFEKSELTVWAEIRKAILMEMWTAHRQIHEAMTALVLRTQELEREGNISDLESAINEYRKCIHSRLDLLSLEAIGICQDFLETAYSIQSGHREPNDANSLKSVRGRFFQYTAQLYGLDKMMPMMASKFNELT
jgi:hypothetical protein